MIDPTQALSIEFYVITYLQIPNNYFDKWLWFTIVPGGFEA
jgi:hypothetical protein